VPAFVGASVKGDSLTVGQRPPHERQVLFFLTSTCPYCRETLPHWKQLAERLSTSRRTSPRVQVVALTTDSMRTAAAYAESNQLSFPLVPFPTPKFISLYRAFSVPQTVAIDSDGRVLFSRSGVINTRLVLDSVIAAVLKPESQKVVGLPVRSARRAREMVLVTHRSGGSNEVPK